MHRGTVLPLLISACLLACSSAEPPSDTTGCAVGDNGEPFELRCTGLYSNWSLRTISPGVQPYAPGIPLWSDGAVKSRWLYLPPGTTIDTSDMNKWIFPVGTKLWKQFVVGGQVIETRLLWKTATGWYPTTYRWSTDQTETTELITGDNDAGGLGYEVPTQFECEYCHQGQKDYVLGFSALSLSHPDATGLTMDVLTAQRLLTDPPATPIVVPGSPLDQQALGILHINCGTVCHNEDYGSAYYTGLWMRLDVGHLGSVQATNSWITGVNQMTEIFDEPGITYRIAAGDPDASCVYYRMAQRSNDNDNAMPPIDSHVVDEAGLQVIGAWIDSLDAGVASVD